METSKPVVYIGIDIGGTLAKLVVFLPHGADIELNDIHDLRIELQEGKILFSRYENSDLTSFFNDLKMIKAKFTVGGMHVTGGGSFKYQDNIREIEPNFAKVPEMSSLNGGFNFLDKYVNDYSFMYKNKERHFTNQKMKYPYFLVNIGSGVSILRFDAEDKFERIGGTSLGGGTFLGMCNMMIGTNDFDQLLEMAQKGQSGNADLLISDIYPKREDEQPMEPSNLAVSLGKMSYMHMNKTFTFKKEDMAKSFLILVAFNISQLAFLYAKIHKVNLIYFAGNFIQGHAQTMECISHALNAFSATESYPLPKKELLEAIFLKHDGYLGALAGLSESFKAANFTVTHV